MTKVFVQTHGCSANLAESEAMMGLLRDAGILIVDDPEYAHALILNICTVKGPRVPLREIRKYAEQYPDKALVIAGCITIDLVSKIREIKPEVALVSTHNIHRIVEAVEEALQGNYLTAMAQERINKAALPKLRTNKVIGIVPIASGCDDRCAYCSVKLIKGNVFSYPIPYIVNEVRKNVDQGCKEIWITSQDNGAYGLDKGERQLHTLLQSILDAVPGNYKIRLGMINPRHVIALMDELIEIYQDDRLFKFIHIPLEAGNNEVLGKMNRKYTVHDFTEMVETFRRYVPNMTIATDLIVGFPTETELQFQDSLHVIHGVKPDALNIARFSPRPHTQGAQMEGQISIEVKKDRSKAMTDLFHRIALTNNEKWVGWEGPAVISEIGKNQTFVARNFAYKPIILDGNFALGDSVSVVIKEAKTHDLRAEVRESEITVEK